MVETPNKCEPVSLHHTLLNLRPWASLSVIIYRLVSLFTELTKHRVDVTSVWSSAQEMSDTWTKLDFLSIQITKIWHFIFNFQFYIQGLELDGSKVICTGNTLSRWFPNQVWTCVCVCVCVCVCAHGDQSTTSRAVHQAISTLIFESSLLLISFSRRDKMSTEPSELPESLYPVLRL